MDEEEDLSSRKPHPPSPARMSKVPSWISVGFLLGALVGWTLREPKFESPPPERIVEVVRYEPRPNKIPTVEALFEQYKEFAGWRDDTAEILVYNPDTEKFSEAYEVRRIGDEVFFRSIPQLTRKLANYSDKMPANSPIQFAGVEDVRPSRR